MRRAELVVAIVAVTLSLLIAGAPAQRAPLPGLEHIGRHASEQLTVLWETRLLAAARQVIGAPTPAATPHDPAPIRRICPHCR